MENITSRTIERLRFPITVLVLFIHVLLFAASQGGIEYTFPFTYDSWSHRLIYFFNWIFPRVSVPMFCIISGYLFFQGLNTVDCFKEKYKYKLKSRVRTLLVPYLLWNIIFEIYRLLTISSDKLELLSKSFFLLCKEIFNSFWGM
ncbi:acyltransferase family protein [Bacteroides ovatus]|uniref:acyltransferase family protein n=1 Tax=Bacteroides ovatus TaxID=28116 RepID=UPI003144D693